MTHLFNQPDVDAIIILAVNILINMIAIAITNWNYHHYTWDTYDYDTYQKLNWDLSKFMLTFLILIGIMLLVGHAKSFIPFDVFCFNLIFATFLGQFFINIYLWHYAQKTLVEAEE